MLNINEKIFIIAEVGNTHEGSMGLAKKFIKSAAKCGVDAVKFQAHIFEAESLADAPNTPYFKDETRKEYFDRTSFTQQQWLALKEYSEKECGIEFICSPFSIEAVKIMVNIGLKTIKIASGEVTNIQMLELIGRSGCRVLLSSGMSTWGDLDLAVKTLTENGCNNLAILQCTSEYPCSPENAGLNLITEIRERYKLPVGYSDHSLGLAVPIAAVCLGATVIEKHFTLSKEMYGPDAKFSVTPEELKILVENIRDVEKSIANKIDKDKKAKMLADMKFTFEKSIVSAENLKAGTKLEKRHLTCKKPARGIPAKKFYDIVGKTIVRNISKDTCIEWKWLK